MLRIYTKCDICESCDAYARGRHFDIINSHFAQTVKKCDFWVPGPAWIPRVIYSQKGLHTLFIWGKIFLEMT